MPIGAKLFPRFLSEGANGKSVEVQVTELKTTETSPLSAFEPPAGAASKPGCWNPDGGRLVKKVIPLYPNSERASGVQGQVGVYGVIAADGILRDLRIVSGVTSGLNKATLDAVKYWRYEPYTCHGTPVDVERVLFVNFTF
jgi:TonB family protein